MTGKTGSNLQYTYARIQGILRKSKLDLPDLFKCKWAQSEPEEMELIRELYLFPGIVNSVAKMYEPHLLTDHLFGLAQVYNNFYNNVSVLKAETGEQKPFRLSLCSATAQVLNNGLELLGIEVLNTI